MAPGGAPCRRRNRRVAGQVVERRRRRPPCGTSGQPQPESQTLRVRHGADEGSHSLPAVGTDPCHNRLVRIRARTIRGAAPRRWAASFPGARAAASRRAATARDHRPHWGLGTAAPAVCHSRPSSISALGNGAVRRTGQTLRVGTAAIVATCDPAPVQRPRAVAAGDGGWRPYRGAVVARGEKRAVGRPRSQAGSTARGACGASPNQGGAPTECVGEPQRVHQLHSCTNASRGRPSRRCLRYGTAPDAEPRHEPPRRVSLRRQFLFVESPSQRRFIRCRRIR